jgi:CheY-like chemotaxis protein/anti-sigma regulatory factor (Ser/Thr protein kinase)
VVVREVQVLISRTVKKSVRLETRLAEPAALMRGDEAQIEHAVMNLCLNAIDAMGDEGTLTIATATEGDTVSVSISDTGTGMDEEVRAHAFEPFFTTKPVGKGTGLGLSMVYGTVQAMNGTITLSTKLGVGTTIKLNFPRVAEPAPVVSVSPVSLAEPEPRSLAGLTILVIDDEPLVLRAAVRMLRALGCEVLSASNGRDGIETFKANRDSVSLAIVDLVMPGVDGVATLSEILALAPQTSILLASGYTPETEKVEALLSNHPTVAYLAKPYDPKAITAALDKLPPTRRAPTSSSGRIATA